MSFTIAITGKGGTGKSTISGLLVKGLIQQRLSPVLAVDADANSCLDTVLGVNADKSVGSIREEARQIASGGAENTSSGISKRDLLELKIAECLVEARDFDLISMGRPEGPGCYCYANNVLKEVIRELSASYPYIVIDNEAGLENLSRRIVQKTDLLVMVGEPTKNGIETIKRLYILAREMEIEYGRIAVIINRIFDMNAIDEERENEIREATNADFLIKIPFDEEIARWSERGDGIEALSPENRSAEIINSLITQSIKEN